MSGVMENTMVTEEFEAGLLRRCKMNDRDACTELMKQYNRKIYNTAYRILGEAASAEDALQETMINIYRALRNFRGESKVSTWISRITVNVCLGMLRRGKNRQHVDLEGEFAQKLPSDANAANDPLEHASLQELRSSIDETFRRMSHKQGVVVRLHDMEGNTIQEIAGILGCPVGTVKSRLFYGRMEFKQIFEDLKRSGYNLATVH